MSATKPKRDPNDTANPFVPTWGGRSWELIEEDITRHTGRTEDQRKADLYEVCNQHAVEMGVKCR